MSASANSDTSDAMDRTCWVRVKSGKYIHEEGEFVSQSPVDSTLARVRFYEHAGSKSRLVEIKVCNLAVFSLSNRGREVPLDSYLTVLKMGALGPKVLSRMEQNPSSSVSTQPVSQDRVAAGLPQEFRNERSISTPDNSRDKSDSLSMAQSTRPVNLEISNQSPQRSSPIRSNSDKAKYRDFSPERSRIRDRHRDLDGDRNRDRDRDSDSYSDRGRDRSRGRSRSRSRERENDRGREMDRTTGRSRERSSEDEERHRQEERMKEREIDRAWEKIDRERREERIREHSRERNRDKERDHVRDSGRDRDRDRDWRRGETRERGHKQDGTSRDRERGRDSDPYHDRERTLYRAPASSYNNSPSTRITTMDTTSTASTTRTTTSNTTSSSNVSPASSFTVSPSTDNSTPTTNGYLRNVMHAMNVPERVRAVGLAERPRDPFARQAVSESSVSVAPPVIPIVSATAAQTSTVPPAQPPAVPSAPPSAACPDYSSLGRGDLVQVTRGPHTGLIAVIVEPPDGSDSAQEYVVLLNDGRNSAARLTSGDFVATG